MDLESLGKLMDTLIEKQIEEFELEEDGRRVRIRRAAAVLASPPGARPAAPAGAAPAAPEAGRADDAGLVAVHSPIVGTYYDSPSPGAAEFVQPGDRIEVGQVLCIVEAMKLMNEIEAEQAGELVRKLVTNGQPVEFGQALMLIRPGA
ncbi:MAG: acetyl-CoA carboxylase biotin carboxyl carrier protein [Terriglobales bacterium]